MNLFELGAVRLRRSFKTQRLGPNEARIIYDFAASAFGASVAGLFFYFFFRQLLSVVDILALVLIGPVAVCSFWFAGIYSRLRSARARVKSLVLLVCCGLVAAASVGAGADIRIAVLWFVVATPPICLARLLLSIPNSNHGSTLASAVIENGPVVVIGGAGYIGSHVVELLLQRNYRVRVLDRLMYGRSSLADFMKNPNFEFVEGDAADIARLTFALRGAGAVVHLAGLVGDPACAVDEEFTRHTNIIVTRMVRQVAQSMGVTRLLFASSCSVYGASETPVDEGGPLNPLSLYAKTKIDSEVELLSNVPDNFHVTILRFATVFGHSRRVRFDLVANLFVAQAMSDGLITVIGPQQWRPFIHVRDLARAVERVLSAKPVLVQNQIFNVGDERLNMTILQLGERVKQIAGEYRDVKMTVRDDPQDNRNYAVSFKKIEDVLGYRAETLMDEGIREMVNGFLRGGYDNYRGESYSNVAMTRKALAQFQDPDELAHIYAPLKTK